jgi:D-alanyl-D-alanine carboxypeptidase
MPGLTGHSTVGVGHDIVNYLDAVARDFGITIQVTSGYRSADGQAQAMFDNWVKLNHGKVYKTSTLPPADRTTLDQYWATAHDQKSSAQALAKAKADFLKLAKATVGGKSMHSRGRAIDVSRQNINAHIYKAITLRLREVKEGSRTDIYHFESQSLVPAVDGATRAQWQTIKGKPPGTTHSHTIPGLYTIC